MHKQSNEVSLVKLISAVMPLEWAQEGHQAASLVYQSHINNSSPTRRGTIKQQKLS